MVSGILYSYTVYSMDSSTPPDDQAVLTVTLVSLDLFSNFYLGARQCTTITNRYTNKDFRFHLIISALV